MHALVVAFFEESFNPRGEALACVAGLCESDRIPSIVALHAPHRVQVANHTGDHSRNAGDTLEEDVSDHVLFFCHCVLLARGLGVFCVEVHGSFVSVACSDVEASPQNFDCSESELVRRCFCFAVGDYDSIHLLFVVHCRFVSTVTWWLSGGACLGVAMLLASCEPILFLFSRRTCVPVVFP